MATMVCRGLQSCLESPFIDTTWNCMAQIKPLEFAFKSCNFILDSNSPVIAAPKQCNSDEILSNSAPDDIAASSFLEALTNGAEETKSTMANQESYVHPLFKRSRSTLSDESLALCTEDLGNETGSDFSDFSDHGAAFTDPEPMKRVKSNRKNRGERNFPPPLTTISGLDSILVRSYREDGRLIIDAVNAPARNSYFHVERSHGRLQLSILRSSVNFDLNSENEVKPNDVKEMSEDCNIEEGVGVKVEENGRENEYANVVGVEVEMEKIERPCRCKGGENMENGNGRMLNWEPVWVATS